MRTARKLDHIFHHYKSTPLSKCPAFRRTPSSHDTSHIHHPLICTCAGRPMHNNNLLNSHSFNVCLDIIKLLPTHKRSQSQFPSLSNQILQLQQLYSITFYSIPPITSCAAASTTTPTDYTADESAQHQVTYVIYNN